jgi:hypothetical protein
MHLAVEAQAARQVAADELQRAAVVVQMDTGDCADQPVGEARRQAAAEPGVLPIDAPAGDQIEPGAAALEHARDVGRIVLPIAVDQHDVGAARVCETGRERRRLPEVSRQLDHDHRGVARAQRL